MSAPAEESAAASQPTVTAVASDTTDTKSAAGARNAPARKTPASREAGQPTAPKPATRKPAANEMPVVSAEEDRGVELVEVPGVRFAEILVTEIHPNRKQPRSVFDEDDMAELVHSVREIGVLQPIVVRTSTEEGGEPYELVMGERRWRAVQAAGLQTIPAIVRDTTDDDLLRDALLENLHRSQLNPLEEAAAYQQLLEDFGTTHEQLADRIGRSRPQVSNTLRLLKLPPLVQRRVAASVISAGHARALLGLPDAAAMERLAQKIVAEGMSVRATEEAVTLYQNPAATPKNNIPRPGARHERLDYLASSLSDRLDTNVKISLGARKGRVSIEFASVEDLNRIMDVLSPGASS
ncbi:putative chromosome-partitioning protein ParB [Arthrobacter sp. SO3]|nr:putative chromosome-partitioning protein ParB [Arthrobacter sp. SO3]